VLAEERIGAQEHVAPFLIFSADSRFRYITRAYRESDTPRKAGGLVSRAASKAVVQIV
jgi:hypothetical protein